jgi:hypothetical protein
MAAPPALINFVTSSELSLHYLRRFLPDLQQTKDNPDLVTMRRMAWGSFVTYYLSIRLVRVFYQSNSLLRGLGPPVAPSLQSK